MLADRVRAGSLIKCEFNFGVGSMDLVAGDMQAGFFGEVSTNDLITGTALANLVGLTDGNAENSTSPWLKFALDGQILFFSKLAYRNTLNWDSINAAGCVYGNKIVTIGENKYKIRLLKGAITDPSGRDGSAVHYCEWNRLILPIHIDAKTKSWTSSANVESDVAYWGINYTNTNLGLLSNTTHTVWTQTTLTTNTKHRIIKGNYNDVSDSASNLRTIRPAARHGWRPVLELVQ